MEWKKQKSKEGLNYALLSAAGIITLLAVWQLVVSVGLVNERMLPAPTQIFETLMYKFANKAPDGNVLWVNILASLQVALSGFLAAIIIGVPLGLVMGWWTYADRFIRPIFELVRPVPPIAWIPLVVVWMGIGLKAKALIIFFTAFVPCVINSYAGIKQTKPVHLWVAQTFGASRAKMLFTVAIPTAMPLIFTGLRISLQAAWTTLCAAEMLAANKGLGYMIQLNRSLARADLIIVGMLTIGAIGLLMNTVLEALQKKFVRGGKKQ